MTTFFFDILSKNKALKIVDIETLKEKAYALTGVPQKVKTTDKVVAVIEYRDGSIIDVVKQIEEWKYKRNFIC